MHSEQAQPWQLEANNKCEIAVADEYTGHKPKQLTQRQRSGATYLERASALVVIR